MTHQTHQSLQQYRDYYYVTGNAVEVTTLFFKAVKKLFIQDIETILDEYKLADRLKEAKKHNQKLRILQVECEEGLYLHTLCEVLEARGLLEAADIYGIGTSQDMIITAEQFSRATKPPRLYLKYYCHNFQEPLETSPGLWSTPGQAQFDFIIGLVLATHTANVKPLYLNLYNQNLKPGGIFLAWGLLTDQIAENWMEPHPSMIPGNRASFTVFGHNNPGMEVATELSGWLSELGTQDIKTVRYTLPTGGATEEGKALLRAGLLNVTLFATQFIAAGLITQAEYDEMRRVMYTELTPEMSGFMTMMATLASKPAS